MKWVSQLKKTMIRYLKTGTTLVLLSMTFRAAGQDTVDALIQAFMYEKEVHRLALLVAQRDSIIKEEYYGLANLELDVPVTESTVFAATEPLTYLGEKDVSTQQLTLFGSSVSALRYYRLNGRQTRYTVFSLDEEGKVIFVDFLDSE